MKPKLPDHGPKPGGEDKRYNPRSVATETLKSKDGGFPAHGGPKPMLDANGDMKHLQGKRKGEGH